MIYYLLCNFEKKLPLYELSENQSYASAYLVPRKIALIYTDR